MKDACEELLLKYCDALTLTAFSQLIDDGTFANETDAALQNQEYFTLILDTLVGQFVIPKIPSVPEKRFKCKFCQKEFIAIKTLKTHLRENRCKDKLKITPKEDHVFNYSRNALCLCYLIKDFIDARKHGDGQRIIRLHKFMLLYFKLDHRTKYSGQTLHLISQVNFLLPPALSHELVWNRFINNKGKIDSNVELDRELEHRNKYAKTELHHFQGKITEKSIQRCSQSFDRLSQILNSFDTEMGNARPSGRHTVPDWRTDVLELYEQYKALSLFKVINGREHSCFPSYPESNLSRLDMVSFKKWVYKKVNEYSRMNIYKPRYIFT